jgi:hypothetical protein
MTLENIEYANELVKSIKEKETKIDLLEKNIEVIKMNSVKNITLNFYYNVPEITISISKEVIIKEIKEQLYVLRNLVKAHKYNLERL